MTETARELWWPHHSSRDRETALAVLDNGDVGEVTLEYADFVAIADRIDALEKALREKDEAVQTELCRVCNAYAKDGNMAGATAIDDAARCVAALGEGE